MFFRKIRRASDYLFHDSVKPKIGSILHCRILYGEHTGIYIGHGQVVELTGSGEVKKIPLSEFTGNMIPRNGIVIYVSCDENEQPLGDTSIAIRAKAMINTKRNYNLVFDNCHQFTCGAITGDFENANNFFWMLEDEIKKHFSLYKLKWRAIELNTY